MRKLLIAVLILLAKESVASAQAAGRSWELTATAGMRFREELGKTLDGAALSGGVITPSSGPLRWNFIVGISQLTAHQTIYPPGPGPITQDSRETSFEAAALAELTLATRGRWSLVGGAGPMVSLSTGSTNEGTGASAVGNAGTTCFNSFAISGTKRIGGEVQLLGVWRSARAALEVGVSAAAHTVAAGGTVSPALFLGFRAPLR